MDCQKDKLLIDKPRSKQRSQAYLKYKRYLKSNRFKLIKERVEERDKHQCAICGWSKEEGGNRTLNCHHIRYTHLYEEEDHLEDLITLCDVCHKAIHNAVENKKRFNKK